MTDRQTSNPPPPDDLEVRPADPSVEDAGTAVDDDNDIPETNLSIVWGQFKKYRLSILALYGIFGMFLLAVYAPVLVLDLPFWMSIDGNTSYPWLSNLFNRRYYTSAVDHIFNSLMFLLPLAVVIYQGVMRAVQKRALLEQRRIRGQLVKGLFTGVAIINLLLVFVVKVESKYPTPKADLAQAEGGVDRAEKKLKETIARVPQAEEALAVAKKNAAANPSDKATKRELKRATKAFARAQKKVARAEKKVELAKTRQVEHSAIFPPFTGAFNGNNEINGEPAFKQPAVWQEGGTWEYPFGTDQETRDVFAQMVFGTRIALTIGLLAVAIYLFIGTILGSVGGYFGGLIDMMIMRFIEIMLCFPSFFLILTLAAFLEEPSIFHVMVIIGFTRWTGPARLVRGEFLRLRNAEFVQAAKALGLPEGRIIFRHILPNALGPLLVVATFGIASAILIESTLSFLGVGDVKAPTWGAIMNKGRQTANDFMILLPGFAIFLTVSLFNLVGEGLRDALDPKLRK